MGLAAHQPLTKKSGEAMPSDVTLVHAIIVEYQYYILHLASARVASNPCEPFGYPQKAAFAACTFGGGFRPALAVVPRLSRRYPAVLLRDVVPRTRGTAYIHK